MPASDYGPFTPGFNIVPYNDPRPSRSRHHHEHLRRHGRAHPGRGRRQRARRRLPEGGARDLHAAPACCFIADEIQTGFCRTGRKFAVDHEDVAPTSCPWARPWAAACSRSRRWWPTTTSWASSPPAPTARPSAATRWPAPWPSPRIDVLERRAPGRQRPASWASTSAPRCAKIRCPKMVKVRGKGLLNAAVFEQGFEAWDVCLALKDAGHRPSRQADARQHHPLRPAARHLPRARWPTPCPGSSGSWKR